MCSITCCTALDIFFLTQIITQSCSLDVHNHFNIGEYLSAAVEWHGKTSCGASYVHGTSVQGNRGKDVDWALIHFLHTDCVGGKIKKNNFFLRNKPFIHHSISAASKLRGWQCGSLNMVHWRSALKYSQGEFQVCKLFWILPEIHKDQKMRRGCSSPQERFYTFKNTFICLWNLGVGTVWIMFYVCPIPDLIRFQEKFQVAICIQLETLFVNMIQRSPFSNSFSSLFLINSSIADNRDMQLFFYFLSCMYFLCYMSF